MNSDFVSALVLLAISVYSFAVGIPNLFLGKKIYGPLTYLFEKVSIWLKLPSYLEGLEGRNINFRWFGFLFILIGLTTLCSFLTWVEEYIAK